MTSGKIIKPADIIDHKNFLKESIVNMKEMQEKLTDKIALTMKENEALSMHMQKQKYQKDQDEELQKMYELEEDFLDEEKKTQKKQQHLNRLQKIIDESSLLVSRILY